MTVDLIVAVRRRSRAEGRETLARLVVLATPPAPPPPVWIPPEYAAARVADVMQAASTERQWIDGSEVAR